jgi:hypothetical protein
MIINRAALASLTRWAPRAPDDLNRHDGVVSGEITRLVGVYDADGSLLGELSYFLRARVRRAHCALCAITHGRVRERPAWRASRDRLPVPFVMFHRDDQPADIRRERDGASPAVIAETSSGDLIVLLGREELEGCAGSPDRLVDAVEAAAEAHGLRWPTAAA